jgi:hypothetical protein
MDITMFCKDCGREIRGQFAATCISCVKSAAQPKIERGKIEIYKDEKGLFHFRSEFENIETIGALDTMREMVLLQMAQEWKKTNAPVNSDANFKT